jgi:hypothetical protein
MQREINNENIYRYSNYTEDQGCRTGKTVDFLM